MTVHEIKSAIDPVLPLVAGGLQFLPVGHLKDKAVKALALLNHIIHDDVILDGLEELLSKSPPPV